MTNNQQNTVSAIIDRVAKGEAGTDAAFILKRVSVEYAGAFSVEQINNTNAVLNALMSPEQVARLTQKGLKRTAQLCAFMGNGLISELDAAYAIAGAAVALAKTDKPLEFSQLHALMGVHREGREAGAIAGVSKSRVNRFLGLGGTAGTVTSKVSVACGKNGIFTALGVVSKCSKSQVQIDLAKRDSCAFVIALGQALSQVTDADFAVVAAKANKGE